MPSTRSVVFNLEKNEIRCFTVPDDIRNEELWFSADEYQKTKANSRGAARDWRKRGFSHILKGTFDDPMREAQDFLNAFCHMKELMNQRGLERHCCKSHGEERSKCKERARRAVLETQYRLGKQCVHPSEQTERISTNYMQACPEAKIFARRIAKADEAVAIDIIDKQKCEAIISSCGSARAQRRMSNCTVSSITSFDSQQKRACRKALRSRCPTSPISPDEELYAAIA